MPRLHLKSLLPGLKTLDMFGYVPQLNFKGQTAVTTYPGTFVSVVMYVLMLLNAVQLMIAYNDGSRQNEKFNQETIDRFDVEPRFFSDHQFEIAVLTIDPDAYKVGKFVAWQFKPCENEDEECEEFEELVDEVPIESCSDEKLAEITEYWRKIKGQEKGNRYADSALCLNMEGVYLAGEPDTSSDASLLIGFEARYEIFDEEHPDYDEDLVDHWHT